jgi:hypothetical protein
MAAPRRPRFYAWVLLTGFLLGGLLTELLRMLLPASPTKDIFTSSWQARLGPVPIDLLVVDFTFGVGVDISLMSAVGVVLAYLVARSLF